MRQLIMVQEVKKMLFRNILLFFIVFTLCIMLKICVCAIPSERIVTNLRNSTISNNIDNMRVMPWSSDEKDWIDFWPEYDYLNACMTINSSRPVYSALMNPIAYGETELPGGAGRYKTVVEGTATSVTEYCAYAWGAVTILRPLLIFMKYDSIVDLKMLIGGIFIIICAVKVWNVSNKYISLIFILSLLFVNIQTALITMNTSLCFFLALVGIIILSHVKNMQYEFSVFLIIGILTGYFDWFTTPVVSFSYPAFYICMRHMFAQNDNKENRWNNNLFELIKNAIGWCIGYGGMIVGKFIITSIYMKQNILPDLFTHLTGDMNKDMVDHPNNIFVYLKDTFVLNAKCIEVINFLPSTLMYVLFALLVGLVCIYLFLAFKNRQIYQLEVFGVMLSPFVWLIVFHGHMYVHYFYDYRTLAPILCSLGVMFYIAWNHVRKFIEEKNEKRLFHKHD